MKTDTLLLASQVSNSVVVLGGGVAAAYFCRGLRRAGWQGKLHLVSDEQQVPYERPALTKSYLTGAKTFEKIVLLSLSQIGELSIEAHFGVSCIEIRADLHRILLSDGQSLEYDTLVIATGLIPRQLLGSAEGNLIHSIRRVDQVDRLKNGLKSAKHVTVIGGGWLGLEACSHLVDLGISVALVEVGNRLCNRNAPIEISEWLASYHGSRGVDLKLGHTIETVVAEGRRHAVRLGSGGTFQTDLIIEAIGVQSNPIPNGGALTWTQEGIAVDCQLQTERQGIFAIGDLALLTPIATGRRARFETWSSALAQATNLALRVAGTETEFLIDTWFWSDQSEQNIQVVGFPQIATSVEAVLVEPNRRFYRYLRDGQVIGAVSINDFKNIKMAKRQISPALLRCA